MPEPNDLCLGSDGAPVQGMAGRFGGDPVVMVSAKWLASLSPAGHGNVATSYWCSRWMVKNTDNGRVTGLGKERVNIFAAG